MSNVDASYQNRDTNGTWIMPSDEERLKQQFEQQQPKKQQQ